MESGLVPGLGNTHFSAYNIVVFGCMLIPALFGLRSTRVEYVANQNGARPEGAEPPKTAPKNIGFCWL
ncbi:hypothetical protein CPT03_19575 [Pedobacter ginsengisoli]|uniref:Uncharacterized protein n=1 Tax=Pedobacter ginsengisoli TaxID=363852 RepID=A0A2D1UAG3_9SPHI|nr:hypothetical protein CPT03_19575 [Pedobacter ginsengisoli]